MGDRHGKRNSAVFVSTPLPGQHAACLPLSGWDLVCSKSCLAPPYTCSQAGLIGSAVPLADPLAKGLGPSGGHLPVRYCLDLASLVNVGASRR